MTPSKACSDLIKQFESCRLAAYKDMRGVWTIGFGQTGDVQEGDCCTQEEADYWLAKQLEARGASVSKELLATPSGTTQQQFDAMVSFAYNIGLGGFAGSSVLHLHNRGLYGRAADAFLLWDEVEENGVLVVSDGLHNRREAERALYLSTGDGK